MQSAEENEDECETPFQTTMVAPTAPRRELRTKLFPSDNHKLSDDDHSEIRFNNEKQTLSGHEEDYDELQHDTTSRLQEPRSTHDKQLLDRHHEEDYVRRDAA